MNDNKQPVDHTFFDAAFKTNLGNNKKYIPISNEKAKEILFECLNWHEEVYLPAEKEMEEKLGRSLNYAEQISLYADLKYK